MASSNRQSVGHGNKHHNMTQSSSKSVSKPSEHSMSPTSRSRGNANNYQAYKSLNGLIERPSEKEEAEDKTPHVYTVSLVKRENGGLGFLIRQRDELPYFAVWEIIKNGAAEANGRIRKGDLILKVNNQVRSFTELCSRQK